MHGSDTSLCIIEPCSFPTCVANSHAMYMLPQTFVVKKFCEMLQIAHTSTLIFVIKIM